MKRKNYPKLSLWQRTKLALERCESVDGGIIMGGAEALAKELDSVKSLIGYIDSLKTDLQIYIHDQSIREQIRENEKIISDKKQQRGFSKAIFGSGDEFSPFLSKIHQLREQLKSQYPKAPTKSFYYQTQQTEGELVDAKNKLKKYIIDLEFSIDQSKNRAKQRAILNEESKRKKEAKLALQEEEKERTRALAAAHTGNSRRQATSVKKQLSEQIKILPYCPYCGGDLGETPHADHIYPIAKGGLSTKENMVYVCQPCNKRKSDKPLIQFIQSSMFYDLNIVIKNLSILKKKI